MLKIAGNLRLKLMQLSLQSVGSFLSKFGTTTLSKTGISPGIWDILF